MVSSCIIAATCSAVAPSRGLCSWTAFGVRRTSSASPSALWAQQVAPALAYALPADAARHLDCTEDGRVGPGLNSPSAASAVFIVPHPSSFCSSTAIQSAWERPLLALGAPINGPSDRVSLRSAVLAELQAMRAPSRFPLFPMPPGRTFPHTCEHDAHGDYRDYNRFRGDENARVRTRGEESRFDGHRW